MTKNKAVVVHEEKNTSVARPHSYYEKIVAPPADIIETEHGYLVNLDIPGADKNDIGVQLEDNTLRIKAGAGQYHSERGALLRNEILRTRYEREFYLGNGVDRNNIEAEYLNGILTIKLQKTEDVKPKHITIQ
jgi:HSP20 family protein